MGLGLGGGVTAIDGAALAVGAGPFVGKGDADGVGEHAAIKTPETSSAAAGCRRVVTTRARLGVKACRSRQM